MENFNEILKTVYQWKETLLDSISVSKFAQVYHHAAMEVMTELCKGNSEPKIVIQKVPGNYFRVNDRETAHSFPEDSLEVLVRCLREFLTSECIFEYRVEWKSEEKCEITVIV